MKKHILSILLLSTIFASSCSKEEVLPIDNSKAGEIVSNRNPIGTNQNTTLSCKLSVSEHATNTKIQWINSLGIHRDQDIYENGISYCDFAWATPGEHIIKCKTTYMYGSEFKQVESSYKVMVHEADFCNSLFGDNIKSVLADNPGLSLIETDYILVESNTRFHRFQIDNSVLTRGDSYELKTNKGTPSPKAGYSFFMTEVNKHKSRAAEKLQYKVNVPVSFTPTEEQERVASIFLQGNTLEDAERITLGELVDSGIAELEAQMWVDRWDGMRYKIVIKCSKSKSPNTYDIKCAFMQPVA